MFQKVKSVEPMEKYIIKVIFENGESKLYDVSKVFEKWPDFKTFETDEKLFEQVKVEPGGYGVSWSDKLDLSCNELWENSIL